MPGNLGSRFSSERPHSASSATIVPIDTATLVGATLRLGKRPLEDHELRRLTENLKARAADGDPTAKMALNWLIHRVGVDGSMSWER